MTHPTKLVTGMASVAAAAALAFATASCDEDGSNTSTPHDSVQEATVGLGDAIAAAEREIGGGTTVAAEYEIGKDGSSFEVEILVDGEVREVFIDPSDGRVLEVKVDPEDLKWATAAAARLASAGITLAKAVAIAEAEAHGTAYEVGLSKAGVEVEVLSGDDRIEVEIALADGHVIAAEPDEGGFRSDDDDDDDDEDDDD